MCATLSRRATLTTSLPAGINSVQLLVLFSLLANWRGCQVPFHANMPMSVMLPGPLLTEREALGLFTGVLL
jgi:hypothetical protein